MSDKISWLLLEYDKIHEKSGLVSSGAFSQQFVEWVINKTQESKIADVKSQLAVTLMDNLYSHYGDMPVYKIPDQLVKAFREWHCIMNKSSIIE